MNIITATKQRRVLETLHSFELESADVYGLNFPSLEEENLIGVKADFRFEVEVFESGIQFEVTLLKADLTIENEESGEVRELKLGKEEIEGFSVSVNFRNEKAFHLDDFFIDFATRTIELEF